MANILKLTHLILRAMQALFGVLVLALASALIQQQDHGGTPARVNFGMFATVFAIVSLLYLGPATLIDHLASPPLMTALDALNCIFLLCAGIAMAEQMGGGPCRKSNFLQSNGITNGGGYISQTKRCREANAMTAFLWFAFVAFLASFVICGWNWKQQSTVRRSKVNMKGAKPMSQV